MLEFVRLAGFDGVLPRSDDAGKVIRVNSVGGAPSLQFFERPAEVLKDLAVDVFDAAVRRHDRDQTGDRLDDQPKGFLTSPESRSRTAVTVPRLSVSGTLRDPVGRDPSGSASSEAHAALSRGEYLGWMHGLPQAVKDLAAAKGLPWTSGSPIHRDRVAEEDDLFVRRIKDAGAVVVGKTNTPELGLGSHTFNKVFGTTLNPYDLTKTCGGSTGGGAVALAFAGIRQPPQNTQCFEDGAALTTVPAVGTALR